MEKSCPEYDCRDSFKHERSDRRDRDIRQAITLPRNSCHKSARGTNTFDIPRRLVITRMFNILVRSCIMVLSGIGQRQFE